MAEFRVQRHGPLVYYMQDSTLFDKPTYVAGFNGRRCQECHLGMAQMIDGEIWHHRRGVGYYCTPCFSFLQHSLATKRNKKTMRRRTPALIQDVIDTIPYHHLYMELPFVTRAMYEIILTFKQRSIEDSFYIRSLWRHLFLGEPLLHVRALSIPSINDLASEEGVPG